MASAKGVLKSETEVKLRAALDALVLARTQHGPQVEAALAAADEAMRQWLDDQVPDVKGTNSGGAKGSKAGTVPGSQGEGKGGGPGVLQIAPQDGAGPRAARIPPHSVRKARLDTALLRLRTRG